MSRLLLQYIRLALEEAQARVPQQLLPKSDSDSGKEDSGENECIEEFSGAAAAPGYTAPLGMPKDGRPKNASERRKKR